jgi:hypothetical protein
MSEPARLVSCFLAVRYTENYAENSLAMRPQVLGVFDGY